MHSLKETWSLTFRFTVSSKSKKGEKLDFRSRLKIYIDRKMAIHL